MISKKSDQAVISDPAGEKTDAADPSPERREVSGAGCVIAAAGLSSRMGAFKPLLPLGNETILCTGVLTMKEAGVSPLIVVTGRAHEMVEESLADLDVETVFNPEYDRCQMLDSVKLGLLRLAGRCRRVLFAPADAPLYRADLVKRLVQSKDAICAPFLDGEFGHPVCFDAALIPEILAYRGPGGLAGALDALGKKIPVECTDPGAYLDADTPEDYETMKRVLKEREG